MKLVTYEEADSLQSRSIFAIEKDRRSEKYEERRDK
jgi:hypothetical protein